MQITQTRPAKALKNAALYQRLKASQLYELYWRMVDRSIIDERDSELAFYRRTLEGMRPGALIFDIGANQGYKVDIFLRLGAEVVAVDPDEANQVVLRDRFQFLRWKRCPVSIVPKAVSSEAGVVSFWVDEPGSAKNTMSSKWVEALQHDRERFGTELAFAAERKVEATTLEALMVEFGVPFFVKIDVEGHELGVLQGMRRPVPYLSFEVNLPEFLDEGVQCIERLQQVSAQSRFNYAGPKIGEGLRLADWVDAATMAREIARTADRTVEIFCRTPG